MKPLATLLLLAILSATPVLGQMTVADIRRGAEKGDPYSQALLGLMYHRGGGELTKDDNQAVAWLRKSAAQGYFMAYLYLGDASVGGWGEVPKNPVMAASYWRKSAQGGRNIMAEERLGGAPYFVGNGTPAEELAKLQLAAKTTGNKDACFQLGLLYLNGQSGLPKDQEQAVTWFSQAVAGGSSQFKHQAANAMLKSLGK